MAAVWPMWQIGELFGVSGVRESGRPMAKGSMCGRVSGLDRKLERVTENEPKSRYNVLVSWNSQTHQTLNSFHPALS